VKPTRRGNTPRLFRGKHSTFEIVLYDAIRMKTLVVVVKPFRAEAVLRAAADGGATAWTVREAKGFGRQKGYLDQYRGSEYGNAYLPKVEVTILVPAAKYESLAEAVAKAARTGRIGDGKVFVIPVVATIDF
jgi:nitrogen regulatory protein P-II 2